MVDSFGTGVLSDEILAERVKATFDFRPAAIARDLDLLRPIYKETSSGGTLVQQMRVVGTHPFCAFVFNRKF